MPEIASFYGIRVYIQFNDHAPPHVHAYYGEHEAKVQISDGTEIAGALPRRAANMVREWSIEHRDELEGAWSRAMAHEAPGRIGPLA